MKDRRFGCGLALAAAVGLLLMLSPINAWADTFTYNFTSDHCTTMGGCLNGITSVGTITLADAGTNTVLVTVNLPAGFGFVDTGAGAGAAFFFNMDSTSTITITNLTAGWSIPNVINTNQQASGAYAGDGLMNLFNH